MIFTSSFFFFLTPQPPISTLFPYTTLFRSHGLCAPKPCTLSGLLVESERQYEWKLTGARAHNLWQVSLPIDRKSTRLNSSHLGISYAVFCLKKKKKKK